MPSGYAHYQFGQLALASLPEEIRRTVQRFQQLYNVGLHGPDPFFFHRAVFHSKIGELGHTYHFQSGKEFFETAAARIREHPSEGAEAYLFGVLCHYALDSACHPMIREAAAAGTVGHTELETEFDRCLMVKNHIQSPQTYSIASTLRLTWGECVTVAGFYPPATAYTIRQSIAIMRLVTRAQAMKNRELVEYGFHLVKNSEMVMYSRPNRKCAALIPEVQENFDRALAGYASKAAQLLACLREQTPLGDEFEPMFG